MDEWSRLAYADTSVGLGGGQVTKEAVEATAPVQTSSDGIRAAMGLRIRNARRLRGWSLRELSARSGVSKALLSSIENGAANPSLETLWKIVEAIELPFSELIQVPSQPEIVRQGDVSPMMTASGAMAVRLLFASPERQRLEFYELSLRANARSESRSHYGAGTKEYVFVLEGELQVGTAGDERRLSPGDAMVFPADRDHAYESSGDPARLICIVAYGAD